MWESYTATREQYTVVGDLRLQRDLYSPQLDNARDLLVWLPPGHDTSERRYPVIYMHDAQNLFDAVGSYSGEWQVDETMTQLCAEGMPAIIVGIPNSGNNRRSEYNPYNNPASANEALLIGRGEEYLRFVIDTVKPLIDATFKTNPAPDTTGIAGSSMGGLISHYGFLKYPEVFGFCGAFSTAYWFGNEGLLKTTHMTAQGVGQIYMDVGTQEGPTLAYWLPVDTPDLHDEYVRGVQALRNSLIAGGYRSGVSLLYVEETGAMHNETAWARRLPSALRFLLARRG